MGFNNEEYKSYMEALAKLASNWVYDIRKQYAEKALDMYNNDAVRQLVLAYGEAIKRREDVFRFDFKMAAESIDSEARMQALEDSFFTNTIRGYAESIAVLFGIKY